MRGRASGSGCFSSRSNRSKMLWRQCRYGARQPGDATIFLDYFLGNRQGHVRTGGDETIVIRTEGDNRGLSSPTGGDGKNPGSRNSGSNTTISEASTQVAQARGNPDAVEGCRHRLSSEQFVILCNKVKHYADPAFRRRGIRRRWGTGRRRGRAWAARCWGSPAWRWPTR